MLLEVSCVAVFVNIFLQLLCNDRWWDWKRLNDVCHVAGKKRVRRNKKDYEKNIMGTKVVV